MTTKILATFVLAVFALVPASAQRPMEFDVPFDFTMGTQSWSAGKYVVTFPHQSVILLRTADQKRGAFVLTNAAETAKPYPYSRMVFNRYGDRHFLSTIWTGGTSGRILNKSKSEKELALRHAGAPAIIASR